MFEVRCCL